MSPHANVDTKFVNTLFLKNLLENQFGESYVMVKKFSIEPIGRDKFNTTRSSMNLVTIRYSSQRSPDNEITVVAKIKPTSGDLTDEYKKCDVFDKETQMYKNILPYMVNVLKKAGGKIEIGPE